MNIYTYTKVTDFITKYEADSVYHNKREHHFRTLHPVIYSEIIENTSFLANTNFIERLYCYTNNITSRPPCAKCSAQVSFGRDRQYNTYCSQRCSMMDMRSLLGVDNPSQLQSVKDKKKATSIEKYGVDNVSKSTEVKTMLRNTRLDYWNSLYKYKTLTVDGLTKKKYDRLARQFAAIQYDRHKGSIDPLGLKGKEWHVDHVFSVMDGFINDVPIDIISDISNLRLIAAKENYSKGKSSSKTLKELYEDVLNHSV